MSNIEVFTTEEVFRNAENFMEEIEQDLSVHPYYPNIRKIYESYVDVWPTAPASSNEYYHNSFIGGYVEHIRNVVRFAKVLYNTYIELNMDISGFSITELLMVAYHHDLGKLGYPIDGYEMYQPETSEWHIQHQGVNYQKNQSLPFMLIQDRSLFILQKFGVMLTENEFLGIKIHDGLYDETNIPYYKSHKHYARLRTKLPFIIHQADLMAAQFEFDMISFYRSRHKTSVEWNI